MQSPRRLESSSQPRIDRDAVLKRERSLAEPRYGVSLVTGRPLPGPVVDAIRHLQSQLADIAPEGVILPEPGLLHITVLRGRSSPSPCSVAAPPPALAAALKGATSVTLEWPLITLEPDGAIRAYTSPSVWPFSSAAEVELAVKALLSTFAVQISLQQRLWATLGTLRAATCAPRTIKEIQTLLRRHSLPTTAVTSLKLLYYQDLQLASADILQTYE